MFLLLVALVNSHSYLKGIVWFQKISIPPNYGGNLKFRRGGVGGGGSKVQEIPERRGVVSEITFPDAVRCCDDPVRKSLLIYFADILHRINQDYLRYLIHNRVTF